MNSEVAAALSKIVAAIAVVATLFYLAGQIRENNAYTNASTVQEGKALYAHVFTQISTDGEPDSIKEPLNNEASYPAESARLSAFSNTFFAWFEDV